MDDNYDLDSDRFITFRRKITYLAPGPGELPGKYLMVGSLTWVET